MKRRNYRKLARFPVAFMLMVFALQVHAAEDNPIKIVRNMIEKLEKQSLPVPASLQKMQARMAKIGCPPKTEDCPLRVDKIAVIAASTVFEMIRQEWDGSEWRNAERFEVTWHDTHGLTGWLNQEWDGSQWVNRDRLVSALNAREQIISTHLDGWDGSAWVPFVLNLMAYDAQGNLIEQIARHASEGNGELQNFRREIHTYQDDKLMKTDGYFWYEVEWRKTQQTEYVYDSEGLLAEETGSYVIDGQVMNMGRNVYTYFASGMLETKTQQSVNIRTLTWVDDSKTTYQYHVSGELTSELYQVRDDGAWKNIRLYTAVYNDQSQLIEEVDKTWEGGDWLNQERELYSYDADGNNTVYTEQIWENGWQGVYRTTSTFDGHGRQLEVIGQNRENDHWVNDERRLYNHAFETSLHEDGIELPESIQLENFPNPFNPSTTIQITLPAQDVLRVRIYDLRGRAVKTLIRSQLMHAGLHVVQWDGTDESGRPVTSGLYFSVAEGEKATATARLMMIQ